MQIEAVQEKYVSASAGAENVQRNMIDAYEKNSDAEHNSARELKESDGFKEDCPQCQCEKCRARRYQDISDDGRVSFQMPTKMDPTKAKIKVLAHEMEHVRNEQHRAEREDEIVVSQSVRIMHDRCEECGRDYVKGGFTSTVTRPNLVDFRKILTGALDNEKKKSVIGIA